tara:strand:+ start:791 stop:1138 length:348 start_codon:yes stop_codon:yes gene_type:complete
MQTPVIFHHVTLNGIKYPKVILHWYDITGSSGWADDTEFKQFRCAEVVTEGYVYEIYEENNTKFVRTFSSYITDQEEISFGDRGCFPIGALKPESRQILSMVELYLESQSTEEIK